ncbi:SCO6745 family protein [Prauserella cavernicola]|uniref:SalK n=1 Tax=Prauserella cavernicola TaxID=2800127 RepID=A0A934V928_9PSEU|nr:hypothetical protein [Prauserella cavernicola]MBK1788413.1 hypothetical protein [Prauserella cavernicola]
MDPEVARSSWVLLEPVHDVTYFAPQARASHEAVGLRGFWRGYVAMRAAPLGQASLGAVTAAFHNFAPAFLARSLPAVWELAPPATALAARSEGAVAALDAAVPELRTDPHLPGIVELLHRIADAVSWAGRPLAAANAALARPDDGVAALWQAATTLREHRGDGHVAVLVSEGINGIEAHVLRDAADGSRSLTEPARGWTAREWADAADRVRERGLISASGALTDQGVALREHVERRTDVLAAPPYAVASDAELDRLAAFLRPFARTIAAGVVPFPNPVGAPAP